MTNDGIDDEITDKERAEALEQMADHAIAVLDAERAIAEDRAIAEIARHVADLERELYEPDHD